MLDKDRLAKLFIIALTVLSLCWCVSAESISTFEMQSSSDQVRFSRNLRGWDFLARRLVALGVDQGDVEKAYSSSAMPHFETVYFALTPREPSSMYSHFVSDKNREKVRAFIVKYRQILDRAQSDYGVDKEVIAAILFVETAFGRVVGTNSVLNRLSRLASAGEPANVVRNFEKLRLENPNLTIEAVRNRAQYLEDTFLPELPALFKIADQRKINILKIKGSSAGAFGMPQFLPTSFLRFGRDGDNDGVISLYETADAVVSVANYLKHFGWRPEATFQEKRSAIWHYNRSEAYIDAVLGVARMAEGGY